MSRIYSGLGTLSLAILHCLILPCQAQDEEPRKNRGGKVRWREDFDAAMKVAHEDERPALVYFTHDN